MADIKCFLVERQDKGTWKRMDTGEIINAESYSHLPAGAIFRRPELEEINECIGVDGKSYTCITPGGPWLIDGRASNCTKPNEITHKCWCRHGEAPNFTVNKVGNTCSAGAGSIVCGKYHGFLRNGYLTNA